MKLTLITDAWFPQVNGVVRTLDTVIKHLRDQGIDVDILSPAEFKTIPCPTYPEIRLALWPDSVLRERISTFQPHAIHIATEGPLGFAARRYCKRHGLSFTTAYHTKFPEYVHVRTGLPLKWLYGVMRWFHSASSAVMVATPSIAAELKSHGFHAIRSWSRGVDLELFKLYPKDTIAELNHLPRPFLLYVGRVSVEKNIRAFLELKSPGTKIVIGDGPQLNSLRQAFPEVHFLGRKTGEDLARHYAIGDVFVFPSLTDTFGLVNLEALASGVPVA
ncbi:MAG: glycosyltransferase family 1 protein, partial [Sphingomonadales bacterium]